MMQPEEKFQYAEVTPLARVLMLSLSHVPVYFGIIIKPKDSIKMFSSFIDKLPHAEFTPLLNKSSLSAYLELDYLLDVGLDSPIESATWHDLLSNASTCHQPPLKY